jgi:hypothetical protein
MSRTLAPVLAVALAALPAVVRSEPLDLDLALLGAPHAGVHAALGTPGDPAQNAADAKKRFAILSSEMALALSSAVLQPASTTGHAGFDFDLEAAYVGVHPITVGGTSNWPTRSMIPHELFAPSFHVRKALPFSFEVGGRMIYLSQSSYFAAQVEAKWALNEGFDYLPDLAVRGAWTQLFGQRDWNLGTGDLDLMVSKRWGVNAVTSFTPYLAARFSFVNASSDVIAFGADDTDSLEDRLRKTAAFPTLRAGFYRTTLGLRMTAYAVSLAGETTYFGGGSYSGKDAPAANDYPDFTVKSSFGGAFKLGFEF